MSRFEVTQLDQLKDRVIVLTGGALGIGAELVRLCHRHGAHVFFGDVLAIPGRELEEELKQSLQDGQNVQFVEMDVANYASNLNLFDTAFELCSRIDHAVSAAGVGEREHIVDGELDLDSVRKEPLHSMTTLEIDLRGPIYFSRIASVYLRQGSDIDFQCSKEHFMAPQARMVEEPRDDIHIAGVEIYAADESTDSPIDNSDSPKKPLSQTTTDDIDKHPAKRPRGRPRIHPKVNGPKRPIGRPRKDQKNVADDMPAKVDSDADSDVIPSHTSRPGISVTKSLTLVSSIAGFTEAPGLTVYSTAKHGVIGLMRSLRKTLIQEPQSDGCKIRTNAICPWMTKTRMVSGIEDAWDKAGLPANEPADVARVIAGVMVDKELNGASLYVESGKAWDVEPGIDRTMSTWMGQKRCMEWRRGQQILGLGQNWQSTK